MQKGFGAILILIITVICVGIFSGKVFLNKDFLSKGILLTTNPSSEIQTNKKIVFTKDKSGELFYCDKDCKNSKQIADFNINNSGDFMLSFDGTKLYVAKDTNIWTLSTDGSELKKITDNNYSNNELQISLLGAPRDNSKIFFSYEVPVGFGDFRENPTIEYGFYIYDFGVQKINYLGKLKGKFIRTLNNEALFLDDSDGYYYKLDLQSGEVDKLFDVQIPNGSVPTNNINTDLGMIIFYSDKEYSQIMLRNYKNNKVVEISPKGVLHQYGRLVISPNWKHFIYKDEQSGIYYSYNREKDITTPMVASIYIYSEFWLDEDNFVYWTPNINEFGTVYKYNMIDNKQEVLLENVYKLIN